MKRAIAIILLAHQLVGCYAWKPQTIAPDSTPSDPATLAHVRVTDRSGRILELAYATQRGDSLHGRIPGRDSSVDTTIALTDVTGMQVRSVTAAPAVLSLILLGGLAAYIAVQNCACGSLGQ